MEIKSTDPQVDGDRLMQVPKSTDELAKMTRTQITELTNALNPMAIRKKTDNVLDIIKACAIPSVLFILFVDYRFGRLVTSHGDWAILVALNTLMVLGIFVAYDALRNLLNQWRELLDAVDTLNIIVSKGDDLVKQATSAAATHLKEHHDIELSVNEMADTSKIKAMASSIIGKNNSIEENMPDQNIIEVQIISDE